MALEQQLERSEELLEVNEQNKRKTEQARGAARQAQNQVRASAARVQQAQNQLQQAIAAQSKAQSSASQNGGGSSSTSSQDAAVSAARAALSAANMEHLAAQREQIRAESALEQAESAQKESSEKLSGVVGELQAVSQKYALEMSKTQALMNAPEGHLASPLYARLGVGRERVNDLRRRIAASLGIAMPTDSDPSAEGYRGSRRGAAGSSVGTGGAAPIGPAVSGYQSPYVKTTYQAPVTYTDPKTGERVTKNIKRTVYQNSNLDPNMVIPAGTKNGTRGVLTRPMTNLELMRDGKAPFIAQQNSDGSVSYVKLELHHLTGEETLYSSRHFQGEDLDGSMVEIPSDVHDEHDRALHGLTASSFRRDADGNKTADDAKYNKFREDYWKYRAAQFDGLV